MGMNPAALAFQGGISSAQYTTLALANAAVPAGGTLYIDRAWTLTAHTSITASQVIFAGGSITLGAYNLTVPPNIFAFPYSRIFTQAGAGKVIFFGKAKVSPCWWGADHTGNSNGAAALLTRQACQYAVLAINTDGGKIKVPAGYYIMDVTVPVVFGNNTTWQGDRGETRFDYLPSTVPLVAAAYPLASHSIFCCGDPLTMEVSAQPTLQLVGEDFCGAMDVSTLISNAHWDGIDLISFNQVALPGTTSWLNGLMMLGCLPGCTVKNSRFIGMPNDGANLQAGSVLVTNCLAWLNGFTGGELTHNGISNYGWWDITNPTVTSSGAKMLGCDLRYNRDEGAASGGIIGAVIDDCTIMGNSDKNIENSWQTTIHEWQPSEAVVVGPPPSYCYNGANLYKCTSSGTTAGSGGPTGTGTGIADGGAVWAYIGKMPALGRVPNTLQIDNTYIDGAIPASVIIDGQSYNIPVHRTANSFYGIGVANSCETTVQVGDNVQIYNIGNPASSNPVAAIGLDASRGGDFQVGNVKIQNSYGHYIYCAPSTSRAGINNCAGSVRVASPAVVVGSASKAGSAILAVSGSARIIEIGKLSSSGSITDYGVSINHDGSTDRIVLDGTTIHGSNLDSVQMQWNGINVPNPAIGPITLRGVNGYNSDGANIGYGFFNLRYLGAGTPTSTGRVRVELSRASYQHAGRNPIRVEDFPAGLFGFDVLMSSLAEGANAPGNLFNALTCMGSVNIDNTGLPGQAVTYGTAAPTTQTWAQGAKCWNTAQALAGPIGWACTVAGTPGTWEPMPNL